VERGSSIRFDLKIARSFIEIPGDDSQLPVNIGYIPEFEGEFHIRTGRPSEYE